MFNENNHDASPSGTEGYYNGEGAVDVDE